MIVNNTLHSQEKIFAIAKHENVKLIDVLSYFGKTYNDLIYERSYEEIWQKGKPPTLDDFRHVQNGVPFVSFFTGCGGLDIGFEASGYHHVSSFEINKNFCQTLRKNRPNWKIFGPPNESGDVSNTTELIRKLERLISRKFEGVFIAGPPCQPFSIAANQRFSKHGSDFKRTGYGNKNNGNLLFDYLTIVKHFRPYCFLIENVTGLRDIDNGKQLRTAIDDLERTGYYINDPMVLNAEDFGVPQNRERLFVVGSRVKKTLGKPKPAHKKYGAGSVLFDPIGSIENSETRIHKLDSVERYVSLNYGQRDHLGRIDRLSPIKPSKTVIAGGTKGGGRSHLHPEIPRTLSVRECARLQSFPDEFSFSGSTGRQFTQVGNAVPPVLATQIGTSIAESVFGVNVR